MRRASLVLALSAVGLAVFCGVHLARIVQAGREQLADPGGHTTDADRSAVYHRSRARYIAGPSRTRTTGAGWTERHTYDDGARWWEHAHG